MVHVQLAPRQQTHSDDAHAGELKVHLRHLVDEFAIREDGCMVAFDAGFTLAACAALLQAYACWWTFWQ